MPAHIQVSKSAAKANVWDEIRAKYNATFASEGKADLQQLAIDYAVHYGTLRNKASKEKWSVEAQKLRDEVLAVSQSTVVPIIVKHRVETIDKHLQQLGGIREMALQKLAKLVAGDKLTPDQTLKVVFDSLRAERMLNEMIGDGLTHGMSEDEKEQAMFQEFVKKFFDNSSTEIKNITPSHGTEAAPLLDVKPDVEIVAPEAVPEVVDVSPS